MNEPLHKLTALPCGFYDRDVVEAARGLLGKLLARQTEEGLVSGRIVEVEAYQGLADTASHSYRGQTPRNATMFGPGGRAYVYSIHARWCMNAVTEVPGKPTAVLLRAVEPLEGIELMQRRRGTDKLRDLARGPARLCEAFSVDRALDGWDLSLGRTLWIAEAPDPPAERIIVTPRIGVTSAKDAQLRFALADNPYVSGPKRLNASAI